MGNSPPKKAVENRANEAGKRGGGGGGGIITNEIVQATQQMKVTIDTLEKRRQLLETKSNKAKQIAMKFKNEGNKQRALMALKRKKILDEAINRVDAQMFKLEHQQLNLEGASVTSSVVKAMETGINAQRKLNKTVNADKVEDLMADQDELTDDFAQVQEAITGNVMDGLNDPELEAALSALDADDIENKAFKVKESSKNAALEMPSVPNHIPTSLPNVPTTPIKVGKKPVLEGSDEAALAELEAQLL